MRLKQNNDHVIESRVRHHAALKAMLPSGSTMTGIECWRKLRHLECKGQRLALRLCNGPEMSEDEQERIKADIHAKIEKLFGRQLPGFFINLDPRGS